MRIKQFFQRVVNWELWPFYVLYFPIGFMWFWYCIKSRSFWFFSSSNPTITFGGFEGESKKEMYDQLPPHSFPKTIYVLHDLPFEEVKKRIEQSDFKYPFIVKPDVGKQGILFRKIDNEDQLEKYHKGMPVEYIVQELVQWPVELSVFYYRHPEQQRGVISGFIQKELLEVYGDGQSTLWQLILNHPRAKLRLDEMKDRHEHRLERVLPKGQHFYLSYAGNHNRGARFINLKELIDADLLNVFDGLSHYTDKFYYGRYDIKCTSVDDLKKGFNYSILEFNGCGAEPNHIYDCNMSLGSAYREILKHWKVLYEISKYNHEHGTPYWSFSRGRKFLSDATKHFTMLAKYD
ncbi:MAG: hypothetical protein ABUT20_24600 [Bacteroidota bacterium]